MIHNFSTNEGINQEINGENKNYKPKILPFYQMLYSILYEILFPRYKEYILYPKFSTNENDNNNDFIINSQSRYESETSDKSNVMNANAYESSHESEYNTKETDYDKRENIYNDMEDKESTSADTIETSDKHNIYHQNESEDPIYSESVETITVNTIRSDEDKYDDSDETSGQGYNQIQDMLENNTDTLGNNDTKEGVQVDYEKDEREEQKRSLYDEVNKALQSDEISLPKFNGRSMVQDRLRIHYKLKGFKIKHNKFFNFLDEYNPPLDVNRQWCFSNETEVFTVSLLLDVEKHIYVKLIFKDVIKSPGLIKDFMINDQKFELNDENIYTFKINSNLFNITALTTEGSSKSMCIPEFEIYF